jgi:hypothetical protein
MMRTEREVKKHKNILINGFKIKYEWYVTNLMEAVRKDERAKIVLAIKKTER